MNNERKNNIGNSKEEEDILKKEIMVLEKETITLDMYKNKKIILYIRGVEEDNLNDDEKVKLEDFYINESQDQLGYCFDFNKIIKANTCMYQGKFYGKWIIENKPAVLLNYAHENYGYPSDYMAKKFTSEDINKLPPTCIELFCMDFNKGHRDQKELTFYVDTFDDFFVQCNFYDLWDKRNIEMEEDTEYTIDADYLFSFIKINDYGELDVEELKKTVHLFKMRLKNRIKIEKIIIELKNEN